MTTLDNRPNSAQLVVDVQNSVVAGAPWRDQVVANIGQLSFEATDLESVLSGLGRTDRARTDRRDRRYHGRQLPGLSGALAVGCGMGWLASAA